MPGLHRFEVEGRFYAVDPESCFCFESDAISRDVLEHYPHTPVNRILSLLEHKHPRAELEEVIGELEWLRATKSILQSPKLADLEKAYRPAGGLREVSAPWLGAESEAVVQQGFQLLLGRSGSESALTLELETHFPLPDAAALDALRERLHAAAERAGKKLTMALRWETANDAPEAKREAQSKSPFQGGFRGMLGGARDSNHGQDARATLPPELQSHDYAVVIQLARSVAASQLKPGKLDSPKALAGWLAQLPEGCSGRIVLQPRDASFGTAAQVLHAAGFTHIELDVDAPFLADASISAHEVFHALKQNADWYAEALLARKLFRLDPIAGVFLQIYQGVGNPRRDPAGVHALALDVSGDVYPGRAYTHWRELRLASAALPALDADVLSAFENAGSLTMPDCMTCWARNLCGGGSLAVHYKLTGNVRTPHPDWSAAQRAWLEAAVVAFNRLSSAGVNFTQVYESLGPRPKLGLWQAARLALNAPLTLRPLAEADAPMLVKWENWNASAYFLHHEAGLLLTNEYDREMDAVHPQGFEQEFVVSDSKGAPLGLLRLRPAPIPGLAWVWFFLRRPSDYHSPAIRKGFKSLLGLLPQQHDLRQLLVPAGPMDGALGLFLQSAGFVPAGTQREALFLHGAYHDVQWHVLKLAD